MIDFPLIIIQARMSSTRLPGKVMMTIGGWRVIDLLIHRLKRTVGIGQIVVATTDEKSDDVLCKHLDEMDVLCFRGSENDVLLRFAECAKLYKAKTIIRVTADCPFVDPRILDDLLKEFCSQDLDYACLSPNFAEGLDVEVMTVSALLLADALAEKRSEREHVTLYFNNHPEKFRIVTLGQSEDHGRHRFTLDTIEDMRVLEAIACHFGAKCPEISSSQILEFLNEHPDIAMINSHIIRNEGLAISLKNDWVNGDG